MLTIRRTAFKSAILCAASKDVRFYLNGVHIERTASGPVHVVSTDGNRLFVGTIAAPECDQAGPWRLTVPLDVAKRAAKGKGDVTLQSLPDGRYELDGRTFSPIDGVFPDWRRVIPANPSGEVADFDHALMADAQLAVATWHGVKPTDVYVKMNGTGPALVSTVPDGASAWAIVMPARNSPCRSEPARPSFAPYGA